MPQLTRIIAPAYPHHVIQQGNCRQQTFFNNANYRVLLNNLAIMKIIISYNHYCKPLKNESSKAVGIS